MLLNSVEGGQGPLSRRGEMSRHGKKRILSPYRDEEHKHLKVSKVSSRENSVAGTIQRVRLERFMCHDSLDWTPNENVNFVTGENGSGKSSLLQGLVLGLLADSKHTKRYRKMQEFIQKGCNKGVIQVTLKNKGENAWKPEVYGPSITFCRSIIDSGTSTRSDFCIKDHEETIVLRSVKEAREEGKRILENYRIYIDNPIAILQQEEAKELLKVESPQNLYMFFKKATLLKQCIDQYSAAKTELDKTMETIKRKKKLLKSMGQQVTEMYDQVQQMNLLIERDKEEDQLMKEYMWAMVVEDETESKMIGVQITQKEKENPSEKLKALRQNKITLEDQLSKHRDDRDIEKGKCSLELEDLNILKEDIEKLRDEQKHFRNKFRGINITISTVTEYINIVKEEIDRVDLEQRGIDQLEEATKRKQKLDTSEMKVKKLNDEIKQFSEKSDVVKAQQESNKHDLGKCREKQKVCQRRLDKMNSDLCEMEGLGDQKVAVFDRLAPCVAEEIRMAEKQHKFGKKPLGPVGSYLRLCKEAASNTNLARLVETELGINQIRAYLCNSDKDRQVLWDIFSKVYGSQKKPQIFTSRFLSNRHAVSKVSGDYKTVMDYLEFIGTQEEATVIFNHLVDQKSIESVVICQTQQQAKTICTYKKDVPRNMAYAITWDFNRFFPPTNFSSYRSYFIESKPSQMLGISMKEKVEDLRNHITETNISRKKINAMVEDLMKQEKTLKGQSSEISAKISGLWEALNNLRSEISQLKAKTDGEDSLDGLKEKLDEKIAEVSSMIDARDKLIKEWEQVKNLHRSKNTEYVAKTKELAVLSESLSPFDKDISMTEGQIYSNKKEILNQERLLKKYQSEISALKKEQYNKKENVKKYRDAALKATGEYIEQSGTAVQLSAKIRQIRKSKQNSCDGRVTEKRDSVHAAYMDLYKQYKSLELKINSIEKSVQIMEEMDYSRQCNLLFIRNTISKIVERRFAMLSEKFSKQFGSGIFIDINHKQRELKFIFNNQEGDKIDIDINSLSGGEKSYAQMCLIASLWENMNPPFRVLDEWDVFLDAINRKSITRTLLNFGLSKMDHQFIFISPQSACDIAYDAKDSKKVSIFEMKKSNNRLCITLD